MSLSHELSSSNQRVCVWSFNTKEFFFGGFQRFKRGASKEFDTMRGHWFDIRSCGFNFVLIDSETKAVVKELQKIWRQIWCVGNLLVIFVIFFSSVVDWIVAFRPWFLIAIGGASIVVFLRKNRLCRFIIFRKQQSKPLS